MHKELITIQNAINKIQEVIDSKIRGVTVGNTCPTCGRDKSESALLEVVSESLNSITEEFTEAVEYLNKLGVPTNGVDSHGNKGNGKNETLTMKQRLTWLTY